jgi:hypothetical protein
VVKEINNVQEFANNIGYLTKKFLKPNKISLPQMFNSIKEFRDDPALSAKLFAFCHLLYEQTPKLQNEESKEGKDTGTKSVRKQSENLEYLPLVSRNKTMSGYPGTGNCVII